MAVEPTAEKMGALMVTQGPHDAMVKPTKHVHLKYRLEGQKLVLTK